MENVQCYKCKGWGHMKSQCTKGGSARDQQVRTPKKA